MKGSSRIRELEPVLSAIPCALRGLPSLAIIANPRAADHEAIGASSLGPIN